MQESLKQPVNRAVLVGLSAGGLSRDDQADEETLEELAALLETAVGSAQVRCSKAAPPPTPAP